MLVWELRSRKLRDMTKKNTTKKQDLLFCSINYLARTECLRDIGRVLKLLAY